jgi:hypothetical protein
MTEQEKKNIIEVFEKILNIKPTIEETYSSPEQKERELFIKTIYVIESINLRAEEMYEKYGIDLSTLENLYFVAFESLLELKYNNEVREIIYWYLYDRFDEDGKMLPIEDLSGKEIFINTPEILYDIISLIK